MISPCSVGGPARIICDGCGRQIPNRAESLPAMLDALLASRWQVSSDHETREWSCRCPSCAGGRRRSVAEGRVEWALKAILLAVACFGALAILQVRDDHELQGLDRVLLTLMQVSAS